MAAATVSGINLHDLPESILTNIFLLVSDVRSRNAMALACRRWRYLERATRASLALRGHVRAPFLVPTCFPAVADLDLSLLSPWGHHPFLHHQQPPQHYHHHHLLAEQAALVAARLAQAFPCVSSLAIYARDPSALAALTPLWPDLRAARLVRWHQRPADLPLGGDLAPLLAACPALLALLHLVDPATLSSARIDSEAKEDAAITGRGLEGLFAGLPQLEDLALDICHNVRDAGPSLEAMSHKCPKIKSLKLGQFHGVCRGAWLHLDGVAVCGRLESLCIKNSGDLTDSSLVTIARGCSRLSKFEIHGCNKVTEMGIKKLSSMLRFTLVDIAISGCQLLDATRSLRAVKPIRDRVERLHIDCIWANPEQDQLPQAPEKTTDDSDVDQVDEEMPDGSRNKKCRYSDGSHDDIENRCFWFRTWTRLRCLSLWIPAGEVLTPLGDAGMESCPQLEDICIKVEGDCRMCPRPRQRVFGLSFLARYPRLAKMKLDCGEAFGYALTAPTGHMDLSLWERFYLHGIGDLSLYELDYWPPQDKEVNQRSLSLPATGLIQGCLSLRKLFIHGTTHEHFMRFFLGMPGLRDVQLREDYYPAPENDMSTEMRVDSCSRFEETLNSRLIPD
ncbi:hypothetical protein GW17_00029182 [Ensete ventricosum]|nr:hypothetical protein GW17_00029182 [Ensete ventricosum]